MKKLFLWIASKTRLGTYAKDAQKAVEGKKTAVTSLGTAFAGTISVVLAFIEAEDPFGFITTVATRVDFAAAMGGFAMFFNSLKGEKIRSEICTLEKEIEELLNTTPPGVEPGEK